RAPRRRRRPPRQGHHADAAQPVDGGTGRAGRRPGARAGAGRPARTRPAARLRITGTDRPAPRGRSRGSRVNCAALSATTSAPPTVAAADGARPIPTARSSPAATDRPAGASAAGPGPAMPHVPLWLLALLT